MEAALEFSFYVLGVVFALGVLMVLVLIKDVFFHGRFNTVLPQVRRVPTTALDAARETLKTLQEALGPAQAERRDTIAYEIKHLEHRISTLEDKTYTDQADYYAAAKARERTWREWRALHEEARHAHFSKRRELKVRLDELRQDYRKLDREVDEEYHRAVARDSLTLEELHSQGVLEPEVLRPQPEPGTQPAAGGGAAGGDTAAAPGARPRSGKWMTPLPPYPPAEGGLLAQADMARPEAIKAERTYVDATFSSAQLPGGMLSGADLSRSSFAEVEFVGAQRLVNCTLVATDLRRIEMRRAEQPHLFQDCDMRGASLAQAQLAAVVFRRCNLSGTHWRSARLDRVKFESCRMDNIRWEGVDLSRTVMSEDMLAAADFAFASKPPLNLRQELESPPELSAEVPPAPDAPPAEAPREGQAPPSGQEPPGGQTSGPPPARATPQPTGDAATDASGATESGDAEGGDADRDAGSDEQAADPARTGPPEPPPGRED